MQVEQRGKMTKEQKNPINLAVHETADQSDISLNPHLEASADSGNLNNSVHDDENVDTPNLGLLDNDENLVNSQVSIANLSAG